MSNYTTDCQERCDCCDDTKELNDDISVIKKCLGCYYNYCDICEPMNTFDADWEDGVLTMGYWCKACYDKEIKMEQEITKELENHL
mgnify:CR=1 FL=1